MNQNFKEIKPEEIGDNPFKLVGSDWMLITAGVPESWNTMTASWGGFGNLWMKNICWCVIRPTRYTYEFMNRAENFTLSFFTEEWRKALNVCGSKSGRDIDKAAATGLTPITASTPGTTTFEQARLVIECKKLYFQDIDPANFIDPAMDAEVYPMKDYHRFYIGEIAHVWVKK